VRVYDFACLRSDEGRSTEQFERNDAVDLFSPLSHGNYPMLREQLADFLQEHLPRRDQPLVVGVSGGPDSLALLHALTEGGLYPRDLLVAGHLNHHLRPTATAEATFVAGVCRRWDVTCTVEEVDVAAQAEQESLSLEEAGRLARYRFLAELARRAGAPAVAVAHNADDQAETVLMHFLRGSGLAGLRGMLPAGPLPGAPDLVLLRPLLKIDRAEIEAYCATHCAAPALQPVVDESNEDITFFRNRLRHELLPYLEGYNPQIRERLQHTAEVIAADYALLARLRREAWEEILRAGGDGWLRVDLEAWQALPLSLRRSTLRHAIWQLRRSLRDVTFAPVEQARQVAESGVVGARATLPGDLLLTVEYDAWRLETPGAELPFSQPQLAGDSSLPLSVPGRVELAGGWVLEATVRNDIGLDAILANRDPWHAYLDPGPAGKLLVRTRRPGELFQPLGMGGHTASIKELMINEKIPARLRSHWPLVANREHVLWVVGHHLDRRARVTPATAAVIHLYCYRPQE